MALALAQTKDAALRSEGVRILLASDDVAARLTLEAVLEKSGYSVETAASSAEAMERIENNQFSLVLCDFRRESPTASRTVIRLARRQEYRPATAYLTSSSAFAPGRKTEDEVLIEAVDIPRLLTQIADLIASRAAGRSRRALRRAG